jgi:hypothetical protein
LSYPAIVTNPPGCYNVYCITGIEGAITLTVRKPSKNGKSSRKRSAVTGRFATKDTTAKRTIKYHPGPTTIPREKIREAVRAVVSKSKSS